MSSALRIGIAPNPPGIYPCILSSHPPPDCQKHPGIELEILFMVLQQLNLNYTLIAVARDKCGSAYETEDESSGANGSGLIGLLLRNEIDITGNTCTMYSHRAEKNAFSIPVYRSKHIYVFRKPHKSSSAISFRIFRPFTREVWICIVFLLLIIILCNLLKSAVKIYGIGFSSGRAYLYMLISGFAESLTESGMKSHFDFISNTVGIAIFRVLQVLFCSVVLGLYNSGVTSAFVVDSTRSNYPFTTVNELAVLLARGYYHFTADHSPFLGPETESAEVKRCYDEALKKHSFWFIEGGSMSAYRFLLTEAGRFGVYSSYDLWFQQDMFDFADRERLTSITDETVGISLISYLWRKDFKYKEKFAVHMSNIAALALTVRRKYLGNSYFTRKKEGVSPDHSILHLSMINSIIKMYFACILLCFLAFAAEMCVDRLKVRIPIDDCF